MSFVNTSTGSITAKTLEIQHQYGSLSIDGTITADEFIYYGYGLTNEVADTAVLNVGTLHTIGSKTGTDQVGLLFTSADPLKNVGQIVIEGLTARTGITFKGDFTVNTPILLTRNSGSDDSRIEIQAGSNIVLDSVTAEGSDTYCRIIQIDDTATVKINNLSVGENSRLNLQTYASADATDPVATYELSNVVIGDGGQLYAAVYGSNSPAYITGDVSITLGSGALVDFGGARNKDWLPQNIYFNADSLTVTVTDSSDEGKVLLSGTDGNLKTSTDNIKVIATAENNTGDAAADLAKIAGVVQLNVKDSDDTSIAQNVSTPHTGYTVTQEADDINDAASGIVTLADDGSATVTNITKVANVNVTGIAETSAIGLQIWRNEINDMNKRMGELRDSMGEANGVWARVYNGKARSGSLSITNKYTTFQFGYDHQVSHGVWLGGAVHYTDGDQDFAQGGGENSTYGFTAYGSWLADNGFFLDVTGKVGRIKNSFDITTSSVHSTGSYHTNAVSVSAEAGWRVYPFENPFFIEPQVELMYGHVFGEDYRTSTGMTVSQSSADTIIGRAGFALGIKCPGNRGNAYIRASVLHDWDGDADYAYTSASGVSRKLTEELGGTWYEYGIGANFNATKQLHIYADAERSSSGVMDTDYRINVGVRYAW